MLNETAHCANGSLIKILYSAVFVKVQGHFRSDHLARLFFFMNY